MTNLKNAWKRKRRKALNIENAVRVLKGGKKFLMALKAKYFQIGEGKGRTWDLVKQLKILTP